MQLVGGACALKATVGDNAIGVAGPSIMLAGGLRGVALHMSARAYLASPELSLGVAARAAGGLAITWMFATGHANVLEVAGITTTIFGLGLLGLTLGVRIRDVGGCCGTTKTVGAVLEGFEPMSIDTDSEDENSDHDLNASLDQFAEAGRRLPIDRPVFAANPFERFNPNQELKRNSSGAYAPLGCAVSLSRPVL